MSTDLLCCLGLLLVAGIAATAALWPSSSTPLWRELLLPEEITKEQLNGLFQHIAAMRQGPVRIRVASVIGRLRFFIGGSEPALASVSGALSGLSPQMRLGDKTDSPAAPHQPRPGVGFLVGWTGPWPLLRTDDPETSSAALLGTLARVERSDELELEFRLWPAPRVERPVASSERRSVPVNPWFMRWVWPAQPPREDVGAIRSKYSELLVRAEILVLGRSDSKPVAEANGQRVIAALRAAGGSRGVLRYGTVSRSSRLERIVDHARPPRPWGLSTLLSPGELVGIAGLPVAAPQVSGIAYGVGPRLMPPVNLPAAGRVFARSNWSGAEGQLLAQPVVGGLQHSAIVGPTGSGKSTAVINLVQQDMLAGRGAFVLDLKGDLVSDLLERVPKSREAEVIVLEPARGGAQPGLQLFPAGSVDAELTSDLVLGTLQGLFSDSWGIRSSQYLSLGLKTLAATPGSTLVELPLLFTDAQFRKTALRRVRDPWLHQAWQRFLSLSAAEQATHTASPLTKLEELTGRSRLRLVLGQRESQLNFTEVLARGRVVLVSLPPGLLGLPATRLLAALTLWQFFQAVEGRAALPAASRRPFMAYIDEIGVLSDLPLPLDSILERARGHGVGLTLSPQALSQLDLDLRRSLLANVHSLVAFAQTSAKEAELLASSLPGVTGFQLQHLGAYEVAMRLSLGPGAITPTMTGKALPPPESCSSPDEIRRQAAERWGQTIEAIDAALQERVGSNNPRSAIEDETEPPGSALGVTRRQR